MAVQLRHELYLPRRHAEECRRGWQLPVAGQGWHRLSVAAGRLVRSQEALLWAFGKLRRPVDELRPKAEREDRLEDPVECAQRVREGWPHSRFDRARRTHVGIGAREAEPRMVPDEYVFVLIAMSLR